MKVYLLSPIGVPMNPVLFPVFKPYWEQRGCIFVDRIEDSEVIFFDLHCRLEYNQSDIDFIVKSNTPIISFDEWDRGGLSSDEWPYPLTLQQEQVFGYSDNGRLKVSFCRLLDNTKKYTNNIYPYEKPISYEEPMLTFDELFNRDYDVVFIANTAPSRESIAQSIRDYGKLKYSISIGAKKIEFTDFVNEHRKGKMFISSGAGGYTDERKQFLFSIAGLIQEDHNQLLAHPFTNMDNCIKISNPPTKKELDIIYEVVNDKEKLYQLYQNNYHFMKQYYSSEYIANYILDKINNHL